MKIKKIKLNLSVLKHFLKINMIERYFVLWNLKNVSEWL